MKICASHSVIRRMRLNPPQGSNTHPSGCQRIRTGNNSHSPTYYLTTNLQFHPEQMWLFFCGWYAQNPSLPRCQLPEKQGQCLLSQLLSPEPLRSCWGVSQTDTGLKHSTLCTSIYRYFWKFIHTYIIYRVVHTCVYVTSMCVYLHICVCVYICLLSIYPCSRVCVCVCV